MNHRNVRRDSRYAGGGQVFQQQALPGSQGQPETGREPVDESGDPGSRELGSRFQLMVPAGAALGLKGREMKGTESIH